MPWKNANTHAHKFYTVIEPPNLFKLKYDSPRLTRWRAHLYLYKLSSLPSVTKDLGKSTSQPRP
jgi:hypothetical protein